VCHLKWISTDGIKGVSPVTILRESIGTALAQTAAAGRMMKNGTTFPGYLISTQTLSADKIRDAREEWDRNQAGFQNTGRPPILNGAFDFKQTNGMSMVDAQFVESRRFELQEIARLYRIPPFLIGDSTASTTWGTGIQEQTLGFLNFCLDPHLIAFEQALEAVLLTSEEISKGYYFRFDRDELASVSRQDTASYFQTMRSIGVYSVNDIRRKLDEPVIPADSGGDDYSLPFNNTGGAAQAKAEKQEPEPAPKTP
jgi:HK97 family phage portal protein